MWLPWLLLTVVASAFAQAPGETCEPKVLLPSHHHSLPMTRFSRLEMFRWNGLPKQPLRMFTDVFLDISVNASAATEGEEMYKIYQGSNCSSVEEQHQSDQRLFGLLRSVTVWRSGQLAPFHTTIVGVDTAEQCRVGVTVWKVNWLRAGVFLAGLLLFVFSRKLVRNTLFYYTSGCSVGVFASLLLVVFIVYRMAPKKTLGLPILVGGWSVSVWMLHFAYRNFASIVMQYQKAVAAYFVTVLVVSFAVCYRRGPPTDVRSHNLAQWTMQACALAMLYFSAQIPEISLAVMGVLVLWQLTRSWIGTVWRWMTAPARWMWRVLFPVKPRLLTEDEYRQQTREATERELLKLRQFCRSPDADSWRMMSRVSDPSKFAKFVDGSAGHVSSRESEWHQRDGDRFEEEDDYVDDMYLDDAEQEEEWRRREQEEREWRRRMSGVGAGGASGVRRRMPRRRYGDDDGEYSDDVDEWEESRYSRREWDRSRQMMDRDWDDDRRSRMGSSSRLARPSSVSQPGRREPIGRRAPAAPATVARISNARAGERRRDDRDTPHGRQGVGRPRMAPLQQPPVQPVQPGSIRSIRAHSAHRMSESGDGMSTVEQWEEEREEEEEPRMDVRRRLLFEEEAEESGDSYVEEDGSVSDLGSVQHSSRADSQFLSSDDSDAN